MKSSYFYYAEVNGQLSIPPNGGAYAELSRLNFDEDTLDDELEDDLP